MPNPKFPAPSYNSIIETDPQIVKVPLDYMGWGSRKSALPSGGDVRSNNPAAPGAPEMTLKHIG